MSAPSTLIGAFLMLVVVMVRSGHSVAAVPTVYEDEFLTVRAGIPEIGTQPIHLGDLISLVIQLEFDATQVQVEKLDSDFFQRGFADQKAFKLYAGPVVTRSAKAGGRLAIRASGRFQILDCPEELAQCLGSKRYELPIMIIAYQLIDGSGNAVNDKSIRFRPWPESITIAPTIAVSGSPGKLADYFPGGAYQQVLPISDRRHAALIAVLAGTLILGVGIRSSLRRTTPSRHAAPARDVPSRWESTLTFLRTRKLPDDQWADAMRRCATWYCLDELSFNPYGWLENGAMTTASLPEPLAGFRAFFVDLLNQDGIEPQRRDQYLNRFTRIVENRADSGSSEILV